MSKPSKKNLRPKKKMRWQMRDVTKKSATHKKTKGKSNRIVLAAALTLSLLTSSADDFSRRYEQWENAPLGIGVTACGYSTRGVYVRFETDLEPPYVVGVYRAAEEGLGRRFPVAEVETSAKEAFIPGDFTFVTVFVQVLAKSAVDNYAKDDIGRRTLTRSEWDQHVEMIRNAAPFVNTNASVSFEVPKDNVMDLIDDYTWSGFLKTTETNFCFTLAGRKAEKDGDGEFRMVPHEYSFRISNGRNDIGTGYRIMVFEDSGVCQAQRAYSSRTNMSDTVIIPCGFRALTSHNGYIYTTDWEGRRYFQRTTNRIDHIVY